MYNSLVEKIFQPDPCSPLLIEYVWIHVHVVLPFFCFFFSFLACVSGGLRLLFNVDFSTVNSVFMYCMYCSRTHKYHFLTIFLLKIGSMVLFTHLKFILLQCFQFSVFSFQFQQNKLYPNRPIVFIYVAQFDQINIRCQTLDTLAQHASIHICRATTQYLDCFKPLIKPSWHIIWSNPIKLCRLRLSETC